VPSINHSSWPTVKKKRAGIVFLRVVGHAILVLVAGHAILVLVAGRAISVLRLCWT
jgi:hypothetical protein